MIAEGMAMENKPVKTKPDCGRLQAFSYDRSLLMISGAPPNFHTHPKGLYVTAIISVFNKRRQFLSSINRARISVSC